MFILGKGLSREKLGEALIPDDLLDDLIAAAENDEIYAFAVSHFRPRLLCYAS
jgi:hypothetical protein